ncbi:DUF6441 family protein [Sphingomonas nostoxanthinifaciens]|uniref:DUF6441 family protein n=1 Tax=Sphingomonas nostoxanthinifaciens TaxID=2872652 RepID=UPI001CC1DE33|nr:DUF6441 family protein [Sphingomonas nostoxanthinifaciens]
MTDGVEITYDAGAFEAAGDQIVRSYLTAGANAVRGTTKWLERRLEEATQQAVPGRLWRAWTSTAFPRSGPAANPAGNVFLNGRDRTYGALAFWTEPGAVRGTRGQYLAVPLPAAGPRGRNRDLTPAEWERAHPGIRLQFIYRQGRPSILAAIGGTTNARSGSFRPLSGKRQRFGRGGANPQADAVVPIFVLLPMVPHRDAFAIQPIANASEAELTQEFYAAITALT